MVALSLPFGSARKGGNVFNVFFTLLIVVLAATIVSAWSINDQEIFRITAELQDLTGDDAATFYSMLKVEQEATEREISKAYRKRSLELHPDKNPSPNSEKIYSLLTTVANILKNEEARSRYDFHLRNGIPRWHTSGFFYRHYKPGVPEIILYILLAISGLQYAHQYIQYRRLNSIIIIGHEEVNKLTQTQIKQIVKKSGLNIDVPKSLFKEPSRNMYDILTEDLGLDVGVPPLTKPPGFENVVVYKIFSPLYTIPKKFVDDYLKAQKSVAQPKTAPGSPTKKTSASPAKKVSASPAKKSTNAQQKPHIVIPGLANVLRQALSVPDSPESSDYESEEAEMREAGMSSRRISRALKKRKSKTAM